MLAGLRPPLASNLYNSNSEMNFDVSPRPLHIAHEATRCALRMSGLPIMRVPLALEIGDERGAEMAIGLVAGVGREIVAKRIERFLADLQRAAVRGGADRTGSDIVGVRRIAL
jgi:hypothetical protein